MLIHPLMVHLPIGLLIGNAIFTLLYLQRADTALEGAAYQCLWLGFLFLLPAIAAGTWEAIQALAKPNQAPDTLFWINAHAVSGMILAIIYWQAWNLRRRNPNILHEKAHKRGYLLRLGLGVALLILSGWIGGHMVYTLGIGTNR